MHEHKEQVPPIRQGYHYASAHIDITPPSPCPLSGFASRKGDWQEVESPLEANAILLADDRTRVLFVSADLLYFGGGLTSYLERHAEKRGIAPSCLVLTASHTHFAPATDPEKPQLGACDEPYNAFLRKQLTALIDETLDAPQVPVWLRLASAKTDLNIGRRRRWPLPTLTRIGLSMPPNIVMAPAPEAPRDAQIDVVQFIDKEGKLVCAAWKFACHPVFFPGKYEVSAEFVGAVRRQLRQQHNGRMTVVFWQGFAGDVTPRIFPKRSVRDKMLSLRIGPNLGVASKEQWQSWSDSVAKEVAAVVASDGRDVTGPLTISKRQLPMSLIVDETLNAGARKASLSIQRVGFGHDLSAVFFGAEVCSPYLPELTSGGKTICVGYTGYVFGYLPTEQQITEGGYEGGGYLKVFSFDGKLKTGFEAKIIEAVRDMAAQFSRDA